jgi:hypothetical protein
MGKSGEDLQLEPKWRTITGEEVRDFSHPSVPVVSLASLAHETTVPVIFQRYTALLKGERNPVAHPCPVSLQVAEQKIKAGCHGEIPVAVQKFISSLRTNIGKSGKFKQEKTDLNCDNDYIADHDMAISTHVLGYSI